MSLVGSRAFVNTTSAESLNGIRRRARTRETPYPQELRSERSGYAGSPTGACFQMEEGEGLEPSCLMAWPGFRNRLPPARRHLPYFVFSDFLLLFHLARSTGIEPALPTRQAGVLAVTPQPLLVGGAAGFRTRTPWLQITHAPVTPRPRFSFRAVPNAGHKKTRRCRVFLNPMGYRDARLQEPLREATAIRMNAYRGRFVTLLISLQHLVRTFLPSFVFVIRRARSRSPSPIPMYARKVLDV